MRRFFTVLLVFLMSGVVWGQIVQFNFNTDPYLTVSSKNANLNVTDMALSSGTIETNITTGTYFPDEPYIEESGGWTAEDQISAKNFTFTITANPGYKFSITNISFNAYATSAGPSAFSAEVDGTSITAVDAPSASLINYSQAVTKADLQSAVIKIQGWLNGSRVSTGSGSFRIDDVIISGSVTLESEPEPSNHATNFSAMSNGATQVDLTWTDNDGAQAADGFLILVNTTGTFADPVDGTPQADDTDLSDNEGQVNVAHGVETYSFTGLTPETQYFFKIYPYSNSGVAIDYKTDETVPSANATPTNLLLVENFDYVASTLLTDNGWTAHSASGTNPIEVNNGGLTYADYPSSGIGNAATLQASGEAVHRTFPVTNSGVVYVSFLVNVSSTWTTSDYIFNLGNDPIGTTYRARLFLINGGIGDFEFGLSQSAATADVSTNNGYSYSTTYLLVLKYEIIDGSSNDEVSLFIFDSGVPIAEPVTPTLGPVTGTDLSALGSVALRQTYANTQLIIDGIRVATSWAQAPLPVELTAFTANVFDGKVNLRWQTATEVDNYGFEVQRSAFSNQRPANWENIGFVEGHGNSNSPKNYEFTDSELPNCDAVSYRLKQIDIDGAYEYSNEIEVTLETIPAKFELSQNYPNPFNPVTKIQYSIPAVIASEAKQSVNATLKVYDIIGREVAVLVNESKEAGIYEVEFDASKLSSGLYFYSLTASGKTITKKMMLLR